MHAKTERHFWPGLVFVYSITAQLRLLHWLQHTLNITVYHTASNRCAVYQINQKLCSISLECMCKYGIILQTAVISICKINRFVLDDGQGVNFQQCGTYVCFWLQRDKFAAVAFCEICLLLRIVHTKQTSQKIQLKL